jgi:hypothetical protein
MRSKGYVHFTQNFTPPVCTIGWGDGHVTLTDEGGFVLAVAVLERPERAAGGG